MNDLISQAKDLHEKTIEGPWSVKLHSEYIGNGYGENTFFLCLGDKLIKIGTATSSETYSRYESLSNFIAQSRSLIPALCEELEKAQKRVEFLEVGRIDV